MNKFYVYGHYTPDGKLFYIGKGTGYRARSKDNRSNSWHEVAKNGWTYKILFDNLSNKDALEKEEYLISNTNGLVNKVVSLKILDIPEEISEYFYYDPSSPTGLRRKKSHYGNRKIHEAVGYSKKNNGFLVKFKRKDYLIHRIIWTLLNGKIPDGFVIDHIDGNPKNNNIKNLRAVDRKTNNQNTFKLKDQPAQGINLKTYVRNNTCRQVYVASCSAGEKYYSKEFNIHFYTPDLALNLAIDWRKNKLLDLNKSGNNFSERHIG